MTTGNPRRRPTKLSPETKWEVFLAITAGDISQADADAASTALARPPGRPAKERNWELEAARRPPPKSPPRPTWR
jgi:hypothetical protein